MAERFEQLRGGMSYQALSEAILRKTGVQISAQALNKWSHGGKADPDNVRAVCEFFGVNEAWFMYGHGPESRMGLEEIVNALPEERRQASLDFIKYQVSSGATELFAGDPSKVTEYLKFIDRLITTAKGPHTG